MVKFEDILAMSGATKEGDEVTEAQYKALQNIDDGYWESALTSWGYIKCGEHDEHDYETTCGDVKYMYKMNECCGNPEKRFRSGRRLSTTRGGEVNTAHLLQEIQDALKSAKTPSEARKLAHKIRSAVFLSEALEIFGTPKDSEV